MNANANANEPQIGDLYIACDKRGYWALPLRFIGWSVEHPGRARLRDPAGRVCDVELFRVKRVGLAGLDDGETVDVSSSSRARSARPPKSRTCRAAAGERSAEQIEQRMHARRSRVTREQRARQKLTDRQRKMIFAIGGRLGFDVDDLRALTPQGSISKLSVREAEQLIDRLCGRDVVGGKGTGT